MSSKEPGVETKVTRRAALAAALAAAATVLAPQHAQAEREYKNVAYLGGSDKIDVNNANIHAYRKLRGFYPNLASQIAKNGPYENVDELYDLPGLSPAQKKTLEKHRKNLIALKPAPEYEIDKINNFFY